MSRTTLISLLLITSFMLLLVGAAFAASPAAGLTAPPAQDGGRPLGRQDWVAHIPLACIAATVVVVVDAAFIARIIANRGKSRRARAAGR